MVRRILLGTIVGALAAFAWAYVSWSAVRLYDWALEPLPADSALVDAIGRGAPRDGAYGFPGIDMQALSTMDAEQRARTVSEWREASQRGPVGVLLVRKQGRDPISAQR